MPAWWGAEPCFAYGLAEPPGVGLIPAGSLRRLGRAQRMALAAAHLAVKDSPVGLAAGEAGAVAAATGLGELGETAAFLENMIALGEREPRPACFVNSVHNSLASQIAMGLGLKGENHLFTHGPMSFELALWQALHVLGTGRAEQVLACGADSLSPYVLAAGRAFEWWRSDGAALAPMSEPPVAKRGTLPGEGAAALLLARPRPAGPGERRARIAAVLARPLHLPSFEAEAELGFMEQALAGARLALGEVGFVLFGANGDERLDAKYRQVALALASRLGRQMPWGVYKHLCGEFCTASALGVALAAQIVRRGRVPDELARPLAPAPDAPVANVLVYHLSETGQHSVCVVSR
jgi:3-oxoacyl-(acyl-carrier-protein) synthase